MERGWIIGERVVAMNLHLAGLGIEMVERIGIELKAQPHLWGISLSWRATKSKRETIALALTAKAPLVFVGPIRWTTQLGQCSGDGGHRHTEMQQIHANGHQLGLKDGSIGQSKHALDLRRTGFGFLGNGHHNWVELL